MLLVALRGPLPTRAKGRWNLRRSPSEYTMRELCKVEDRAGADRYFASIMTRLMCVDGEDPLAPRWLAISRSSPFWTKGPLFGEYLRGALHPTLEKQAYECSSKELMNRAGKSVVWSQHQKILALRAANKELKASISQELATAAKRRVKELEAEVERMRAKLESHRSQRRELEQEVGLLRSSLDGAQND
ncbi:hypothetical protein B296_00045022 [Ensete ventricosum]|uniref:Uncharacterized protein n=1 Tax=Ensete ventricosum TaxID=4639 RepID=A0A426YD30_ENSVE|nr:hypothetical protein B296_00045022 [Ensete ventricosum]